MSVPATVRHRLPVMAAAWVGGVAAILIAGTDAARAQSITGGTDAVPGYAELTWRWLPVAVIAVVIAVLAVLARSFVVWFRRRRPRPEPMDGRSSLRSAITDEPRVVLWPVAVLLVVVAVAILMATERGWYVSDNRFIWYWNPSRVLAQSISAWDSQVNTGGPPGDQGQLFIMALGVLRGVGFAPWLAERLSMAGFIAIGAAGVAYVTREFSPRSRLAPVVAGLWWIASPYTLGYLIPSALYLNAALSPWLLLAVIKGMTSESRWRWAAILTLLVGVAGWLNPPALFWSLIPVAPAAAYLLFTGRTTLWMVLRWGVVTGALVVVSVLPSLARSALTASNLAQNLALSETAPAVSQSSSWSESFRGFGFWLNYWNPSGRLVQPWVAPMLNNFFLVTLSFVPVVVAFAVVVFGKARGRLLFGVVALLATAAMVAGFPVASPSPYGVVLFAIYRSVPAAFAFRNSYKAGAGLLLATSVLFGLGVQWFVAWAATRRRLRTAGLALVAVVIVACGLPLWSGAPLRLSVGNDGIPDYWYDAANYLNDQPGAGRTLIIPATENATYRWGAAPQGDLFSSLFSRPFLQATVLSGTYVDTANLINSVAADLGSGTYRPGAIGPIARRLGITYVLIRNDLDWQKLGLVRPSQLRSLREDPDLTLVSTFGNPGQNTVAEGGTGFADQADARLPPVEVYRVSGDTEPVRAVSDAPSMLVSGDGSAWPGLARSGALTSLGPMRYTARLNPDQLSGELEAGAGVTITDTNRRIRASFSIVPGTTLAADETDRALDLFGVPGSQTVTAFPDARSIEQVGQPDLAGAGLGHEPKAAFDGDPSSSWLTGGLLGVYDQGVRVRLKGQHQISRLSLSPAEGVGVRRVISVRVEFPDGTAENIDLGPGTTTAAFAPRTVDQFTIRITGVLGAGAGYFGLSNVQVPGLDLRAHLQVPDDVMRTAAKSDSAQQSLATAPLSYRFDRLGETSKEPVLRRDFRVAGSRTLAGAGTMTLAPDADDAQLSRLLGLDTTAVATSRYLDSVRSSAALAFDGNLDTAWTLDGDTGGNLTATFPTPRRVSSIEATVDVGADSTAPSTITAVVPGQITSVAVPRNVACPATGPCPVTVRMNVAATDTKSIAVQVEPGVERRKPGEVAPKPARVFEVLTNGALNRSVTQLTTACQPDLAVIDGKPVGATVRGTEAELLQGRPVPLTLCSELPLNDGWHTLDGARSAPIDQLALTATDGRRPIESTALPLAVTDRRTTTIGFTPSTPPGAKVVLGVGFNADWSATTGSGSLGRPVELDTQIGWVLTGNEPVTASYGPQRSYTIMVWLSVFMFGLAMVIAVANPRFRTARAAGWPSRARRWRLPLDVATVGFAFAFAGIVPAVLAVALIVGLRRRVVTPRSMGIVAVVLLVAAVVFSVPPLGPALTPLNPSWPIGRTSAHQLARLAAVALMVAIDAGTMLWTNVSSAGRTSRTGRAKADDRG